VRPAALAFNPVSSTLAVLGACALTWLPYVRSAPNRMVSGEAVAVWDVLQTSPPLLGIAFSLALLCSLIVCLLRPSTIILWLQAGLACMLIALLLALAAGYAHHVALSQSPIARTSLGSAFWCVMVLAWLLAADAMQRLRAHLIPRTLLTLATLLPLVLMLSSHWCDELSIMKEFANRSDIFGAAVLRHVQIVLLTMLPTLLIGIPMGWWVHQQRAVNTGVFAVLNVIQTIPSIALFGLLMAPLALLAASYPAVAQAGISGVGLAPGVIALILYSLLPVVRGTLAGLDQVPSAVVNAAQGMGMSPVQVAWRVQLPLSLPVLLSGVRSATIAAVGMATITALIGAGGLGAIMFEGLFSSAQDLVLLGVVPIVALAVLTDALFKLLIQFALRASHAVQPTAMASTHKALAHLGASA
jgi:osmoprotectant transport system permease protein